MLDYSKAHFCPAYKKTIDPDLCYESLLALCRFIKTETVPELDEIDNIDEARKICSECPYSNLNGDGI